MTPFIKKFREIVNQQGKSVAIQCDLRKISYEDLFVATEQLAQQLISLGMGPGCLIAINIEKSIDYIIALLAVWMANAAFMPIDPNLPETRQKLITKQAKPNGIIYITANGFIFKLLHTKPQYAPTLAYIIFTSGSTGKPKGVMIPHDGILPFILCQIKAFNLQPTARMLFYLSIQFDASISDIGTALLSGASLIISKTSLINALKEFVITHVDLPPSLLPALDMNQMPETLNTIIIGGEVCPSPVIREWSKKFRIINVYGPTEATVCTSLTFGSTDWQEPAIGLPFPHMRYLILQNPDITKTMLKPNIGELLISGSGLALAYVNDPKLTEQKFIIINSERYYRTGDLVKQVKDNYIYLGRIDRQLKINGKLIAPEEIEATINQHPFVTNSCVLSICRGSKNFLIAYVETQELTESLLRHFLRPLLPDWMIPKQYIFLKELPKNCHGKIDVRHCEDLWRQQFQSNLVSSSHNQNTGVTKLQEICQKILNLASLPSIHADIIDNLGADSIDIIKIIATAEMHNIHLTTEIIYHLRTIYALSLWHQLPNRAEGMPAHLLKEEIASSQVKSRLIGERVEIKLNNILLTGVTGYLGIHILGYLLINTSATIYCLIRAQDKDSAWQKLLSNARSYDIELKSFLERIYIVLGDITLPKLGLSSSRWKTICKNITTIYHCAAEVNMVKTYNELKRPNLDGIKTIIQLALTTYKKHIHYISTLSVFVATDRNTGVVKEDDNLDNTQMIHGGYAQSKWAAEYYLRQSQATYTIYRLGLITGHSQHGKCSNHDYLKVFVHGLIEIGSIPAGPWNHIKFDATPVDFAAQAVVYLSVHGKATCYHIANRENFSLAMVIESMRRHKITLVPVKLEEWIPKILHSSNGAAAASYLGLCRVFLNTNRFERYRTMDLFQATDIYFDQTNTLKDLEHSGIKINISAERLLDKYIENICNSPVRQQ